MEKEAKVVSGDILKMKILIKNMIDEVYYQWQIKVKIKMEVNSSYFLIKRPIWIINMLFSVKYQRT